MPQSGGVPTSCGPKSYRQERPLHGSAAYFVGGIAFGSCCRLNGTVKFRLAGNADALRAGMTTRPNPMYVGYRFPAEV